MPGIATHYCFGSEVYRELAGTIGIDDASRQAFLLGNQGPDPFLFLVVLPVAGPYRFLGGRLHSQDPGPLLANIHDRFLAGGKHARELKAYALGFACHYFLDSAVHPLVYAQQRLICADEQASLPQRARGAVHATIETEIDEMMLTTRLGTTAAEFLPHKHMLPCAPDVLAELSRVMALAIYDTFKRPVPAMLFAGAVELQRAAQAALDSKHSGLRKHVDYLVPAGLVTQRVLALSHHVEPRHQTMFANDDHIPWPHPFEEGEIMSSSFSELYDQAFKRALDVVPRFAQPDFDLNACVALARGINFSGKRVG